MPSLKEYFLKAKEEKWAIGHFNFSTADQLKAIVGRGQAVALVKSYQAEGLAVFLNADHHKSFESSQAAIDAGYDTVLIDASKMPYEENISTTKKVVEYAKQKSTSWRTEMMIEGELGYLKGESQVQEAVEISLADY